MRMWYVAQSNPQKEMLVWEQLYLRGIEAYCPRLRVHPVNPRARKIKPYFPGYLFIRADLNEVDLFNLRWMPGAVGLVCFGNEAATVPDELIQAIQHRVKELNECGGPLDGLKAGTSIVIREGPFSGFHAIFDSRLSDLGRAKVLIQLLKGRQIRVELPIRQIEQTQRFHS